MILVEVVVRLWCGFGEDERYPQFLTIPLYKGISRDLGEGGRKIIETAPVAQAGSGVRETEGCAGGSNG